MADQRITYPDGEVVSYGYDGGGQVRSVTGLHYGRQTRYVEDIGYDEYGQRVYIRYGNGVESRYSYDENRRWLDAIRTEASSRVYQDMSYRFDEVGNVLGVSNTSTGYQTQTSYAYDALNQLTHVEGRITSTPHGITEYTSRYSQDFSFDAIGNLTGKTSRLTTTPQQTVGAGLEYALDYAYYGGKVHQAERIGQLWYLYDANGNMVEERQGGHSELPLEEIELRSLGDLRTVNKGFALTRHGEEAGGGVYERSYQWDEENRLKRSVEGNLAVDYRYGADGERALKYSSGGETLYFDSMWQETTDYPSLRQSKHIYVGQTRIATRCNIQGQVDAGYEEVNTYYYHSDHLGSAQLVTDSRGERYEHMEYTPYGELWVEETSEAVSKTPFRFTGKELDEETGLYYYGARYLNPRTSMWISADPAMESYLPVAPVSDAARRRNANLPGMGGVFNPVNLAGYTYAGNNPVKYTDPDGKIQIQAALLNMNSPGRPGTSITEHRAIVIHWTGTPGQTAMQTRNYFQTSGTSAHYIVGQVGEIVQAIPANERAYHAGTSPSYPVYTDLADSMFKDDRGITNPNQFTLGIEVNPINSNGNYTEKSYRSSVDLTAKLLADNNIGGFFDILFGSTLIRHGDVTSKPCPKKFMDSTFAWIVFKVEVAIEFIRYKLFGEKR
jgi:RHS repeat-associated protein